MGTDDPTILAWAAEQGRVIISHDAKMMIGFAYQRVDAGLPMPGVLVVSRRISPGQIVESLLLLIGGNLDDEWDGQVRYL